MTPLAKVSSPRTKKQAVSTQARAVLRKRLQEVQRALRPAARQWKKSPEPVHRLRVSARRAVAAIDLLEPLLPRRKARRLRRMLQEVRRACDAARNDDVLLARIERHGGRSGPTALVRRLKTQRKGHQQAIVAIHRRFGDSGRLARKSKKLLAKFRWGWRDTEGCEPTYAAFIRQRLQEPAERFASALRAKQSGSKLLHRLRIRGKRLRYALELAGDAVPSQHRERCIAMLRELQDHLGQINDSAMARDSLMHRLAKGKKSSHAVRIKTLLAKEEAAYEAARKAFARWRKTKAAAAIQRAVNDLAAPISSPVPAGRRGS